MGQIEPTDQEKIDAGNARLGRRITNLESEVARWFNEADRCSRLYLAERTAHEVLKLDVQIADLKRRKRRLLKKGAQA